MAAYSSISRSLAACLICTLVFFMIGAAASAQSDTMQPAPAVSADLSEAEFQAMLGRLSDEQVRDILIQDFAVRRADTAQPSATLAERAEVALETIIVNAQTLWAKRSQVGLAFAALKNRLGEAGGIGLALLALGISGAIGLGVRRLWRRKIAQHQMALAERNATKGAYGSLGTIGDAFLFLLLELSSVLAFAATAMATLFILFENGDLRAFVSSYLIVSTVALTVWSVVEWMFPRKWPEYRLVAISDPATRLVHWVFVGLAALWMFEASTSALMTEFGAPTGTPDLLSLILGIVWIISAQLGFFAIYRATADLLPAPQDRGFVTMLTRNWFVLMAGGLLATWMVFTGGALMNSNIDVVAGMVLKMQLVLIGFWTIYRIAVHYLRAQDMTTEIADAIRRTLRAFVVAAGLILTLAIFGLDSATLQSGGPAERWVQAAINVGLTALIGWAIWDFARTAIDIRLAAEKPEDSEDETGDAEGGLGASRTATLLPLLRSTAVALIFVVCLFSALSSLGVNVAPLVAGAGVLGLAIGFGAQTLVKDIVSGVFFLIDDAFRRGEYIDLGSVKGTVERISVRSLQLRHHLGAVHTIPFGDISALTNYSRDWVIMKLPLRLTFDTDPQQVKKIIKQLGAELMADEILGDGLLAPPKSQGVIQMEDSAMILRVKFTAVPGKQFTIRRELLHRIRAAFEDAGIRFANREVTVRVSEDAGAPDREHAIGAAASRATEAEQPA